MSDIGITLRPFTVGAVIADQLRAGQLLRATRTSIDGSPATGSPRGVSDQRADTFGYYHPAHSPLARVLARHWVARRRCYSERPRCGGSRSGPEPHGRCGSPQTRVDRGGTTATGPVLTPLLELRDACSASSRWNIRRARRRRRWPTSSGSDRPALVRVCSNDAPLTRLRACWPLEVPGTGRGVPNHRDSNAKRRNLIGRQRTSQSPRRMVGHVRAWFARHDATHRTPRRHNRCRSDRRRLVGASHRSVEHS